MWALLFDDSANSKINNICKPCNSSRKGLPTCPRSIEGQRHPDRLQKKIPSSPPMTKTTHNSRRALVTNTGEKRRLLADDVRISESIETWTKDGLY